MKPADRAVPQDVYTRDYFLHSRHGADEFADSGGRRLSPIHERILAMADPSPGRRILDVGCGCGELVIHATQRGAEAVGVDYAEAAHRIAVETARTLGVTARFHLGDVASLPRETFDAIILADVVEHLYPEQLNKLYVDVRERLNPGGRLVIHTWPNRWHTQVTYPVARILLGLVGIRKPKSPRKPHDEIMHVNEQSVLSLRNDLRRAGFTPRVWVEHPCPEGASALYRFAHSAPMIKYFFADHLFALAQKGALI